MGFMAGHLVSAPVSGFPIGENTNVEPAHFWSQGPLVNGVRSWQLITKHDLTHRFHGRTLGVRPSVRVLYRWGHWYGTGPFWSQCPLVNDGVRYWQLITKHDLTHRFPGRPGVHVPHPLGHRWGTGPFWRECPLVNGVTSWQLIIKHDLTHRFHDRSLGVRPCVRVPHLWGHQYGTSPLLEPGSTCDWCQKFAIDYIT